MKHIKPIIIILIIQILLPLHVFAVEPTVNSGAAILMDASNGKILFEKNAHTIMYPASTTKVLTAVLTLEKCKLDEYAIASEYAINSIPNGYTTANIQIGEKLKIKDLLYALMLQSANEAATVLAEHIGGSESNFANMMNEKAKEIGCKNTHFVNANGIHNENHISTAYDLALIGQYAMNIPKFREIVSTTSYTLPKSNIYENEDRTFFNTNSLIHFNSDYYYPYATGVKTGFTSAAQNCLVAGSLKDGIEFISVVLYSQTTPDGQSERYLDTINLFNYGYENYSYTKVLEQYSIVDTKEIANSKQKLNLLLQNDIVAFVKKENNDLIENIDINVKNTLYAPIHAGEQLGTVTYTIEGIEYTESLIAETDINTSLKSNILLIFIGLFLLIFSIVIFLVQ